MFKKESYDLCGDCLTLCQGMDVDQDQAVAWMTQGPTRKKTSATPRTPEPKP